MVFELVVGLGMVKNIYIGIIEGFVSNYKKKVQFTEKDALGWEILKNDIHEKQAPDPPAGFLILELWMFVEFFWSEEVVSN